MFFSDQINCYLYALGFRPNIFNANYSFIGDPGFTYDSTGSKCDWDKNLLLAIRKDLENLNLSFREIKIDEYSDLEEDEYLLKAFITDSDNRRDRDFHFMRFDPKSERWFHKLGQLQPELINKDSLNIDTKIKYGVEPIIYKRKSLSPIYKEVGYYAIKDIK